MRKKLVRTIVGTAGFCFLILFACAVGQAYRARTKGNRFLSDVRNLRVGISTYSDVLRIARNYETRSSVEGNACNEDQCILDFVFDNNWLRRFHLVPGSMFIGSLMVRKGILVRVRLSLLSNPGNDAMTEEVPAAPNLKAYQAGGRKVASGQNYSYVWAEITSAASADERKKAYEFNLACLTKRGGCKDSNQILPILNVTQ